MNIRLIRELNDEHRHVLDILDNISASVGNNVEIVPLLGTLKEALLAHLAREERDFYPPMRIAAQSNTLLAELLTRSGMEMDTLSAKALEILDFWMTKGIGVSFKTEFASLYSVLKERIRTEERTLYTRYLKLSVANS